MSGAFSSEKLCLVLFLKHNNESNTNNNILHNVFKTGV